jgi:hypothetical protein
LELVLLHLGRLHHGLLLPQFCMPQAAAAAMELLHPQFCMPQAAAAAMEMNPHSKLNMAVVESPVRRVQGSTLLH